MKIETPRGQIIQVQTKDGNTKAELKWNAGFGGEWTGRFSNGQKFIDSEVLRYCDPLVPFDTGMLKTSGILGTIIGSGTVKYIAPYASVSYYTHRNYTGAPQRGAYWFERMKPRHKGAILQGAKTIIMRGRQ